MSHDPSGPLDLVATCAFGLEAVVVRELEALGYKPKAEGTGRVAFAGDLRAIVDANLWLRAADRVLIRLAKIPVGGGDAGFDALFEGVRALPWERWIARTAAFPVAGRCVRSAITSEPAVQRTVKRAIVERLRGAWGFGATSVLPETGPRVAIEVSLLRDEATLTIDSSGVGLHKRGYRDAIPGEASIKETLAAGLVLLSVWKPGRPLVDPFCGTGTIAIEAAMIGRSIAPGLKRSFDAERWASPTKLGGLLVDPELFAEARQEAAAAQKRERLSPVIHASDIDERALAMARGNARAAGVQHDIQFLKRDVAELSSTKEFGSIITNPPYGVRIGDEAELERLYRSMPTIFRRLPTWSFHIFTGRLDLEEIFGQPATRRRKLYNSTIECGYFQFLGPRPESAAPEAEEADANAETEPLDAAVVEDAEPADEAAVDAGAGAEEERIAPVRAAPAPVFGGLRARDVKEAAEFAQCLSNNLRHLRRYPSRGITCYRVYERDAPDVPLIIDRYEDRYHAAEYERGHSRTPAQQADWFDLMRRTIADVAEVPLEHVYMKEKHRQRGLSQHEKRGESKHTFIVQEGGLKFEVNLSDYVDTGLFLDHRLTRAMFREQAAGKRVLNLFCYTGSFSVYAAAGGAIGTTSVDLSNTYLAWAQRNMELNGFAGREHECLRGDCLDFLAHAASDPSRRGAYDLVIADPPTFSNSTSTREDWEVSTRYGELLALLAPVLSPKAVVYFSTNYRRFEFDEQAAAETGYITREISRQTVPPEYRNTRIHRCWRLVYAGAAEAVAALKNRPSASGS